MKTIIIIANEDSLGKGIYNSLLKSRIGKVVCILHNQEGKALWINHFINENSNYFLLIEKSEENSNILTELVSLNPSIDENRIIPFDSLGTQVTHSLIEDKLYLSLPNEAFNQRVDEDNRALTYAKISSIYTREVLPNILNQHEQKLLLKLSSKE